MVSDTVKKVLSAESASDSLIAEAKATSRKIITDAESSAEEAVRKKTAEAEQEAERLQAENELRIDEYRRKAAEKFSADKAELYSAADKNKDKTVDALINLLFG